MRLGRRSLSTWKKQVQSILESCPQVPATLRPDGAKTPGTHGANSEPEGTEAKPGGTNAARCFTTLRAVGPKPVILP